MLDVFQKTDLKSRLKNHPIVGSRGEALHESLTKVLSDAGLSAEQIMAMSLQGSVTHGLSTDASDIDVVGILNLPPDYIVGLKQWRTLHKAHVNGFDFTFYSLEDYIRLALKGNPTVLEFIHLEPQYYLYWTAAFTELVAHRKLFISKQVYGPFVLYAEDQFKRMDKAHGDMGAERRNLFLQLGYDPKNASHVLRLLLMGIDMLRTGVMRVKRSPAEVDFLLAIKKGKYSLEEVKRYAEMYFTKAEDALENSTLPDRPDAKGASHLLIDLQMRHLNRVWK